MENTGKIWINKDEWDLNNAWMKWRYSTFYKSLEESKTHELYKEVVSVMNRIEQKRLNESK